MAEKENSPCRRRYSAARRTTFLSFCFKTSDSMSVSSSAAGERARSRRPRQVGAPADRGLDAGDLFVGEPGKDVAPLGQTGLGVFRGCGALVVSPFGLPGGALKLFVHVQPDEHVPSVRL